MAADAALGGVARRYRRVFFVAGALGLVGLIVTALIGHFMIGLTLCVGIGLGFINARLTVSAAARFSETANGAKRPIIFGSMQRLAAITAVALLVAYAFRPEGVAVLGGLAFFHILLLGNTSTALIGELRRTKQ
ncbi:MAG TPA: hypothetical protein VH912_15085 [Streptosporangiaceae bacterium]|jgi:hypothetical protein